MNSKVNPPSDALDSQDVVVLQVPSAIPAEELRELLRKGMDHGRARILVDLSQDNHPNSMKIGVLIRFKNRAVRRGGDLRLLGARDRTLEMLRITRLDTVFELFDDEIEARKSFD